MITVTDLFCGAGGSSWGAEQVANVRVEMAANHWDTAIEVHQSHFPHARHDLADISQADPRRYPITNILIASPECTNHSQARGVSRKKQDLTLFDAPDPSAERSRATMWDVVRFAEQIRYDAIIVENVVEATKWIFWDEWLGCMTNKLGYSHRIISSNSMHHGVPQSRDRIYVVFWRKGIRPQLEQEVPGFCAWCEQWQPSRQAWNHNRVVGRYRQQWHWACTVCGRETTPTTEPAAKIIDWSLPTPMIGSRPRPLADKTRSRILAGLERYGWVPITTAGAGHVWEGTPGMRARPLTDPLPAQHTSAITALATPPGFLVQTAHGDKAGTVRAPVGLDEVHPTINAADDRMSLVVPLRTNGQAKPVSEPLPTATAGTVGMSLVIPLRNNGNPYDPAVEALGTVAANGNHHGLLMRNNEGGAEMVTPLYEPARTMTTKGHQSLLVPYYRTGVARSVDEPCPTVSTKDRCALVDVDMTQSEIEQVIDQCGFRMLEPHEVAAAMAFPDGYIPTELPKKDRVRLAGNAVTPPVMTWLMGRVARALEDAC